MNSIEINAVFCRLKTSTKISLIPQSFSSSPAAYSHFLNSTAQICRYRHSLPSSLCSTSRNMSYHSDSRRRDSYAQQYERYRVSGSRVDRTYRSSSPSTQVSGIRRQSSVHSSLPRIESWHHPNAGIAIAERQVPLRSGGVKCLSPQPSVNQEQSFVQWCLSLGAQTC